jgi:hypothetical protein
MNDDSMPLRLDERAHRVEIGPGCTIRLPDDLRACYEVGARFAIKYRFDGIELHPRNYGTLCLQKDGTIALPDHACAGLDNDRYFMVGSLPDGVIALLNEESQAWFWSPEWQRGERQADEEYAAGNYKTFDDAESFIAYLEGEREE